MTDEQGQNMRESIPKFLNGVFSFVGAGYEKPSLLSEKLTYSVPPDKRTQLIYFRGGNSSDDMVYFVMMRDGVPMRYFAIGARAGTHVPLAVVEDLDPETKLELLFGAPTGATGHVVIDVGLVEI
jgi:assimilatory nitrate reductase catalytic subunit